MKARIAAGVGLLLLWLEHGALAGITEPRWYATYGGSLALGEANFYSERLVNGLPSQSWGGWMRLEFTQPISKALQPYGSAATRTFGAPGNKLIHVRAANPDRVPTDPHVIATLVG